MMIPTSAQNLQQSCGTCFCLCASAQITWPKASKLLLMFLAWADPMLQVMGSKLCLSICSYMSRSVWMLVKSCKKEDQKTSHDAKLPPIKANMRNAYIYIYIRSDVVYYDQNYISCKDIVVLCNNLYIVSISP